MKRAQRDEVICGDASHGLNPLDGDEVSKHRDGSGVIELVDLAADDHRENTNFFDTGNGHALCVDLSNVKEVLESGCFRHTRALSFVVMVKAREQVLKQLGLDEYHSGRSSISVYIINAKVISQ
jgi:hypothetical protein